MSTGIADLSAKVPFLAVKIANLSRTLVTPRKNERVGHAIPAPVYVNAISCAGDHANEGGGGLVASVSKTSASSDGITQSETVTEEFTVEHVDLSHLNNAEREEVRGLLRPFADMWNGKLGKINVTQHRIELKPGATPVHAQPYRAGPKARSIDEEYVKKMLDAGVVEPGQSEWASPVVLVPKRDGSLRFCVDYRKLNSLTVKDSYPLPRMDKCIDSMCEAQFFTALEANTGYWQIPVAPEDRDKTTFTCHAGCLRFRRMPFGLCNAPATFQRNLDILLAGLRWKTCLVYLEDVIFSRTFD